MKSRSRCADEQGFDEFMNVVIDEAEEVYDCSAKPGKEVKPRRDLGEFLFRLVLGPQASI